MTKTPDKTRYEKGGGIHPKYYGLRKRSDRQADEIQAKFGERPMSIVRVRKHLNRDYIVTYVNEYRGNYHRPQGQMVAAGVPHEFALAGCGARKGGLSQAPYNILVFYYKFYSKPGDLIFDPFAGQGAQMQAAWRLQRRYIGYDVSQEFLDFMRKVRVELRIDDRVQVLDHDSRKVDLEDNSVDMVGWTSPPYWDIEDYGDDKRQAGRAQTYDEFMGTMKEIIHECCRVVKPGGFIVWNVMDFRKGGRFYNYHGDTIQLFNSNPYGVRQWDCHIMDWGASFGQTFLYSFIKKYLVPRQHEYTLIFRKEGKKA
jgi:DNA modification methylase